MGSDNYEKYGYLNGAADIYWAAGLKNEWFGETAPADWRHLPKQGQADILDMVAAVIEILQRPRLIIGTRRDKPNP